MPPEEQVRAFPDEMRDSDGIAGAGEVAPALAGSGGCGFAPFGPVKTGSRAGKRTR